MDADGLVKTVRFTQQVTRPFWCVRVLNGGLICVCLRSSAVPRMNVLAPELVLVGSRAMCAAFRIPAFRTPHLITLDFGM